VAGRIRSIEKSNDLIGNRICDLPACSVVPQPTTLPRVTSTKFSISLKKYNYRYISVHFKSYVLNVIFQHPDEVIND
jgi:hypothetical protein